MAGAVIGPVRDVEVMRDLLWLGSPDELSGVSKQ
jgi:hypothetical protein